MSEHSEQYSFQGSPPRACPGESSSITNSPGQVSVAASDLSEGAAVVVTDDYEFPPSSATPASAARSVPGSSSAVVDDDGLPRAGAAAAAVNSTMGVSADKSTTDFIRSRGLGQPGIQQGESHLHSKRAQTHMASVSDKG